MGESLTPNHIRQVINLILQVETRYFILAMVYSVAVSLLLLGIPISVQMLIDQVANTALIQPVVILSVVLFGLLAAAGVLYALRAHLLELYSRRMFARLSGEIALTAINGDVRFFEERGRGDLFNRYFDIMTLQRTVPEMLVGLFTLLFQGLIGFALVSLYHPIFLGFNLLLLLALWVIWRGWRNGGMRTAIHLSEAKYRAAYWLEGLTINNGFFKSAAHVNFALERTNHHIEDYLAKQRTNFRYGFSQLIALLFLYALASAALLGVGGWLVIAEELTLGQLVAAELIMSAIFAGFAPLGGYMMQYYDVAAACEELYRFRSIPIEDRGGGLPLQKDGLDLTMRGVTTKQHGDRETFDLHLKAGTKAVVTASNPNRQRLFLMMLRGYVTPASGSILLGGQDLRDVDTLTLREHVTVIDRPTLVPGRIADILRLADPTASRATLRRALDCVGLTERVDGLNKGMETRIERDGWPFTNEEAMRFKLAAALLSHPSLLVLVQGFDTVDEDHLERVLAMLDEKRPTTVLYFSKRPQMACMPDHLDLDRQSVPTAETKA
ncbi:ABC transporter transmembrane domain-containing protein [Yunchengibacter salinarum]|uniref:ABC transporter transmembrane domain-containing protein n=1 Tax=Yunchengibacter salinarum TaxID=3133399 RepID=UPI0035B619CC